MKVLSLVVLSLAVVACVSPKTEVKPVSTPTPIPTAIPEPDVPGLQGWTLTNIKQEMGQCVQITQDPNLCACVIGTIAAELTFKDFNAAKISQPNELQNAMVQVVKHCVSMMPERT